jgi:signal transduction histidine kinase
MLSISVLYASVLRWVTSAPRPGSLRLITIVPTTWRMLVTTIAEDDRFLLLMQWLVFAGIFIRFLIHWHQYVIWQQYLLWTVLICALLAAISETSRAKLFTDEGALHLSIFFDILLITSAYILTFEIESDFYLFYALPILKAAKKLSHTSLPLIFSLITGALFTSVLITFVLTRYSQNLTLAGAFVRVFVPREVFFVFVLCAVAFASGINAAAVAQELSRRRQELRALDTVDAAIVAKAADSRQVLALMLQEAKEITEASYGAVMRYIPQKGALVTELEIGMVPEEGSIGIYASELWLNRSMRDHRSIILTDGLDSYQEKKADGKSGASIAVQMFDKNGLLGAMILKHDRGRVFTDSDRTLLEALGRQALIGIHSVEMYERLQHQLRPLHSLSVVSPRIQDPRYDLDTVLRLLLTGITAGPGLGWSRAMLFLREGSQLSGKLAVGPRTREEAESVWTGLWKEESRGAAQSDDDMLRFLLDRAVDLGRRVRENREADSPLSEAVRGVSWDLSVDEGAVARCAHQQEPVVVPDGRPDPFRDVIEHVSSPGDRGCAFVCVPLLGPEHAIGVLIVDNRFLWNERDSDRPDLDSLQAYANVAAMRVENSKLLYRLAEQQRTATWKEFTSRIAHILGTRIAAIETAASDLNALALTPSPHDWTRPDVLSLCRRLMQGITAAKRVLIELRTFGTPPSSPKERVDIIQIVRASIEDGRPVPPRQFAFNFSVESASVHGVRFKLSDAFAELLANAKQSLEEQNLDTGWICVNARLDSTWIVIEFRNAGVIIPPQDKKRIFEPYYSTRNGGTGLGLAIVKSTIEEHNGTIEEVGTNDVCFVVRLPALRSDSMEMRYA